jgi:hypothetical protein
MGVPVPAVIEHNPLRESVHAFDILLEETDPDIESAVG